MATPSKPVTPPSVLKSESLISTVDKVIIGCALAGILALGAFIALSDKTEYQVTCTNVDDKMTIEVDSKQALDGGVIHLPDGSQYIIPGDSVCKLDELAPELKGEIPAAPGKLVFRG